MAGEFKLIDPFLNLPSDPNDKTRVIDPNIARWFKTIADRPAVKKALDIIGKITSEREKATDEAKDKLFGRGKFARVA